MMTWRIAFLTAAAATLVLGTTPASAAPYTGEGPLLAPPSDLTWTAAPSVGPGAKIAVIEGPLDKAVPFTLRLALPPNTKIAPHTHPAYERVTVLSGTLYFSPGETYEPANARGFGPGSLVIMPPGAPMFGYTKEETVIQLHGVGPWGLHYLDPADDPRRN